MDPPKPLVVIPPKIRHNILLVMPSNSACKSFQTSIDKFGVKIASRDCTTNEVVSVKCLFCEKYRKDEEDNGADAETAEYRQIVHARGNPDIGRVGTVGNRLIVVNYIFVGCLFI